VRHTIQNIEKYKASLNSISTSYFSLLKTFSRINVSGNYINAIIPTSRIGTDVGMDWFMHDPDSGRHGNDQSAYYSRPLCQTIPLGSLFQQPRSALHIIPPISADTNILLNNLVE